MTWIRLGISELRKLSAGLLPRLAILGVGVIPTLYAGLYLYANHDPYANLDQVPAAIVVLDDGTEITDPTSGDTTAENFGRTVADELTDDGGFDWVETSQSDAESGVRSGRYDAALIIGSSFSQDLASIEEFEPQQASLTLLTNDANNYMARTIAEQIVSQVRDSIAEQVGSEAADAFLRGFADIHTNLAEAVTGASQLLDGSTELASGISDADDGANQLADGAQEAATGTQQLYEEVSSLPDATARLDTGAHELSAGLGQLHDATSQLPDQTRQLAEGAEQVAEGNDEVASYGDRAAEATAEVIPALDAIRSDVDDELEATLSELVQNDVIDEEQVADIKEAVAQDITPVLDSQRATIQGAVDDIQAASGQLDELAEGSWQVASGASELADATPALRQGVADAAAGSNELAEGTSQLAEATPQLVDGVDQLRDGTSQLAEGSAELAEGTGQLVDGSDQLVDGTTELRDELQEGLGQIPNLDEQTRQKTADTIANPVKVSSNALSAAGNYGAGLAPFFLSLATWIGAYVLFLLVKPLSSRALAAGTNAFQTALGGWLLPTGIGVLQVAVMFAVTKFALDIEVVHGVATAGFLVLVSACFVAIVQALNAWLGTVGQFLGLVLMLVQLVTAGGTFPWQTIPEPLHLLHQILPMSYAVQGLRQLLYGGSLLSASIDVLVLLGFFIAALLATTLAARKQRVWTVTKLQPELVL